MTTIDSLTSASTLAGASQSSTRLSENFDTFLTLLTTQLSNQDPLNPVDSAEFTQQLVQYSQVEQQIETNAQLTSLLSANRAVTAASAVAYIGREAVLSSNATTLADGAATWTFEAPGASGDVTLTIADSSGRTVRTLTRTAAEGAQEFVWNGRDANGNNLPEGVYRLSIAARDSSGAAVSSAITVRDDITGVDFSSADPQVTTRTGVHSFDAVQRIE